MRYVSFTCLLLFASVGFAAPPKIELQPVTAKVCEPVFITPKTDAASVAYVADKAVKFLPDGKLANKLEAGFSCKVVGNFTLTALAISATGEWTRAETTLTFVKDDVTPVPVPDPGPPPPIPDPPQPPQPISKGQIFVRMVENTQDAAVIRSKMFQESKLSAFIANHDAKAMRKDVPDPQYANILALVAKWVEKGNKIPYTAVLAIQPDGTLKLLWEGATPETPGAMLELLKKYGK